MANRRKAWLPIVLLSLSYQACQADRVADNDDGMIPVPRPDGGFMGCASTEYDAHQSPAALLVVLDRSSSMAMGNKWNYAAQAIVKALDQDVFDTMAVGLLASPSGSETGPACIFNLPVSCQSPPFPQIDLKMAGTQKSGAGSGVRSDIKTWLSTNTPDAGIGDATPLYSAMQSGIEALKNWTVAGGKRLMLVVTDGTLSCNQLSAPMRPGFPDCNGCTVDWEHPQNIIDLLKGANQDKTQPIESFMVGVPGADTYDKTGCNYPPYYMRGALSAIAYAGSPNNVPANCTGKMFTAPSSDPAVSCHFDLTQGNFNVQALADDISLIRGKVLGCSFALPQPPSGTLNRFQVNVEYTTADGTKHQLFKRKDTQNQCLESGCWDYSQDQQVQLIGKACDDVSAMTDVKVKIVVGCDTVIG
jgi:hypothetical protein